MQSLDRRTRLFNGSKKPTRSVHPSLSGSGWTLPSTACVTIHATLAFSAVSGSRTDSRCQHPYGFDTGSHLSDKRVNHFAVFDPHLAAPKTPRIWGLSTE